MSLHDRIMALPLVASYSGRDYEAVELRNLASLVAAEADELMAEMENAIDQLVGMYALKHCDDAMKSDECHNACAVLEKYNAYKEQSE